MLKEIQGNIWDYLDVENGKFIAVLTNGDCIVEKQDNKTFYKAVMGAGIAKEALDKFPGLDYNLGSHLRIFGVRFVCLDQIGLIIFPTKYHWKEKSSLDLIEQSCKQLKEYMNPPWEYRQNQIKSIVIPRPGCGLGKLDWETEVKPIMEKYFGDDERVQIIFKKI